jgi:hypothetical protein
MSEKSIFRAESRGCVCAENTIVGCGLYCVDFFGAGCCWVLTVTMFVIVTVTMTLLAGWLDGEEHLGVKLADHRAEELFLVGFCVTCKIRSCFSWRSRFIFRLIEGFFSVQRADTSLIHPTSPRPVSSRLMPLVSLLKSMTELGFIWGAKEHRT